MRLPSSTQLSAIVPCIISDVWSFPSPKNVLLQDVRLLLKISNRWFTSLFLYLFMFILTSSKSSYNLLVTTFLNHLKIIHFRGFFAPFTPFSWLRPPVPRRGTVSSSRRFPAASQSTARPAWSVSRPSR